MKYSQELSIITQLSLGLIELQNISEQDRTEAILCQAVMLDGCSIQAISLKKQTRALCMLALAENPKSRRFINKSLIN